MKVKKFLFGLFALLAVAIGVYAGGGKQADTAADISSGPKGHRGTGKEYWLVKYKEPIQMHVANAQGGNYIFPPGDDITSNAWTRAWKDDLNIEVITDRVWSVADWGIMVNLAIASGNMPDILQVDGVQLKQIFEAKVCTDLTDYIENNASDFTKKILNYDQDILNSAKVNGRLMAIPKYGDGPMPMPYGFWIRKDWFDASGREAPRTFTDLENLMRTFMDAHPGSYGMALTNDLFEFGSLAAGFNVYPFSWISKNGNIAFGGIQPEVKEVLALFADWYKKGYFKKDWITQNGDAVRQDLVSGKFGVQYHWQWWGWYAGTDQVRNNGPTSYFEAYELPSKDGSFVKHPKGFDNQGYLVVNKNYKYPDAFMKLVSYYNWVGIDAVKDGVKTQAFLDGLYLVNQQGLHIPGPLFRIIPPFLPEEDYMAVLWAKSHNGDLSKFTNSGAIMSYETGKRFAETGTPDAMGDFLQKYADKCSYSVNINVVRDDRWVLTYPKGPTPDEVISYGSTLTDILKEGFTKIIIGQEPLSYFDTLVAEWKNAGGDVCTTAMNRDYKGK